MNCAANRGRSNRVRDSSFALRNFEMFFFFQNDLMQRWLLVSIDERNLFQVGFPFALVVKSSLRP